MQTFFVQIKCALGRTYEVASALAEAEIASEIYSIAGDFDILAKFYVESDVDIGHFVGEKVQAIPAIADTRPLIAFRAFCLRGSRCASSSLPPPCSSPARPWPRSRRSCSTS